MFKKYTINRLKPCHRKQLFLLHCLFSLVLLSTAAPTDSSSLFTTDADMGIHSYDSIVEVAQRPVDVRIHLRFLCNKQQSSSTGSSGTGSSDSSSLDSSISVEGFVSTYALTDQPPAWSAATPHYVPVQVQQHLNISISSSRSNVPLAWIGPKDWGLWRVRAQLTGPGPFQLQIAGSATVQDLPHPLCPQQQRPNTPHLTGGIWNVLTTTSNSTLDAKTLGFLVLQHHAYHRSLGFSGTILRSNLHESRQLVQQPDVRRAVQQEGLIIWPWEHEHVAAWSTHYWQKPKNQLTLLGAHGRGARLAYFDLDEYLVLPDGSTSVVDARCFGKPLLNKGEGGKVGSWTFVRFQAKTCPHVNADLPCWQRGQSVSNSSSDVELLHDLCSMSPGHGKHILEADMVDIISVHWTASEQYEGNRLVNTSCGHLLHFYSLLEGRRTAVTGTLRKMPSLPWNFDPTLGRRQLRWPEGLAPLEYEQCRTNPAARINAVIAYRRRYKALHGKLPNGGHKGRKRAHKGKVHKQHEHISA